MEYFYTRELVDGIYDIDNPNRVDGEGNQIYLMDEVVQSFPNKLIIINCDEGTCKITFQRTLTSEEKSTLDTIVQNHRDNV